MPLASSSLVQVTYIEEATFGVTPNVGNSKELRITGESLDYTISKESSAEINSSRTVSSMVPTTASASGGLNTEISYLEYDPLIEATLQSTFTVFGTAGVGATMTVDFTATTITASVATTGVNLFTLLKRGQWFRVNAPTSPGNNGKLFRVSSTVGPTSTVITLDPGTPATAGSAIPNVSVATSRLTHGVAQKSFSIERRAVDIGNFMVYRGMTPSQMSVEISSGSLSSFTFDFMGKDASSGNVTFMPGTPVASKAFDIHSGVSGAYCAFWLDGAPLTNTFVQSVSLSYDNALRSQEALCSLGAVAIGSGTIAITGSMEVYFADGALFDKFKANVNTSMVFTSVDGSGNGYVFTLPVANISSYQVQAGGKDQDMMLSLEFTGLRDAANADVTLRRAIFVDRVGSAVV